MGTSARQPPGPPPGVAIYRTSSPGQYLAQPPPRGPQQPSQPGYSQIAVVVVPRQLGPILYAPVYRTVVPDAAEDQDANLHYNQPHDEHDSSYPETSQNIKAIPIAYAQLIPYLPVKKNSYSTQKNPAQQFLKEVAPTTKTIYSEQQAGSVRYAQATPPQLEEPEEVQKLTNDRVTPQQFPHPYAVHAEVQQDPNQPQQYQQIVQPQQFLQPQPQEYVQPQQFVQQPHPYSNAPPQYSTREEPAGQQPKYQQPPPQPQNSQDSGLTYIPINPVMFQKPLVDDDTPAPKSAIFVTQRTPVKKYQRLQPIPTDEIDEQLGKPQSKKLSRPQVPQYQPVQAIQPQQYLIPIYPQQLGPQNQEIQVQLQPQPLKYSQVNPESAGEQQTYQQVRPKKVLPQILRQPLQPQLIAYQPYPLPPQPLQPESYPQPQPGEPINLLKQPLVRYHLQPQLLAIQPGNLRHPQQPEQIEYEPLQQDPVQQQELQPETEKPEEKQTETHPETTPLRLSAKYRKSSLRSRKYRPTPPRVHQPTQEHEEEAQSETQEHQTEYQEDFRIQYPDGLKPQASNFSAAKYRRPLPTNSRHSSLRTSKDRAVQIIDEEDDEYK